MAILFLAGMVVTGLVIIVQHPWQVTGYVWFAGALALLYYAIAIAGPAARERTLDALERDAEEVEFVFTTDGFKMQRVNCHIEAAWSAVAGFYDSRSLLVLVWQQQQLVISRRWFADEEDFGRLVIFLGHKLQMLS